MNLRLPGICGFASLDDLEDWRSLFCELETFQARLLAKEPQFLDPDYTHDALHTWSRMWEYAYAMYHLSTFRKKYIADEPLIAVDLGSGVTFFPFAVAAKGYRVVAVDVDPIVERDLALAGAVLGVPPEQVTFRLGDARKIPLGKNSVDVVYSVSVFEHIAGPQDVIQEVARVLKPGGLFILTIDVGTAAGHELSPSSFQEVLLQLDKCFHREAPERSVHPLRLLTDQTNRVQTRSSGAGLVRVVSRPREYLRKILCDPVRYAGLFGRIVAEHLGFFTVEPLYLTCYGFVGTPKTQSGSCI